MDAEERTAKLMELGYLVNIDLRLWTGSVMIYPVDLGVGKVMIPIGRQSLQVMSKPWITKVSLLGDSIRRARGYKMCHRLQFEGGYHRYVLKGAIPQVVSTLDKQAKRVEGFFREASRGSRETQRVARQVISKNADHIWRTVSHLLPKYGGVTKAPLEWKAEMVDTVMKNRFPGPEQLDASGVSYSFFNASTAPDMGSYQKPFPGLIVDCGLLAREVHGLPDLLHGRMINRIRNVMTDYSKGGQYSLSLKRIQSDLDLYRAFNPILIEGHGMEEALEDVQNYIWDVNRYKFGSDRNYRQELAEYLLKVNQIITSPWAEERKERYTELFGGG